MSAEDPENSTHTRPRPEPMLAPPRCAALRAEQPRQRAYAARAGVEARAGDGRDDGRIGRDPLPAVTSTTAGTPPPMQLLVLNFAHHGYIDEGALSGSEEDTKKSFDFTGELKKLNESGVSDRRSFVQQLENAFATPAKIDLRGLLCMDVPPPVPALPPTFKADVSGSSTSSTEQLSSSSGFTSSSGFEIPHSVSRLIDMKELTMGVGSSEDDDHSMDLDGESASRLFDHKEPMLLPGSDSLASDGRPLLAAPRPRHIASGPSDGQLNLIFKFGGELPAEEIEVQKPKLRPAAAKKPLTPSDIIPPPAHARGSVALIPHGRR
ncbi:hypothetical protein R3P38DRAFT_3450712 [Favolaschia claudopus]|uniref:Uncharacterized protein n=1 Tax=Favolaschia claudopus TaxID=2862362 RepID=A0AAV9ZLX7_9AGAR